MFERICPYWDIKCYLLNGGTCLDTKSEPDTQPNAESKHDVYSNVIMTFIQM